MDGHTLIELLSNTKAFCIYGAQVVAYGAYRAILELLGRKPECFAVTRLEGNPAEIDGVPVRTPETLDRDWLVIVGVTELLQEEVVSGLRARGFQNLFVLTQREEHLLMSAYFRRIGRFPLAEETARNLAPDLALYEVRNHRDQPLKTRPALREFERTIQAGAALSEKRVADLTDDTGVNISAKNKQYCEMSATYWVWKNTSHAWTGIEHYRRHLLVTPEMLGGGVDAVLPLPYLCWPNTMTQFRRFVSEDVQRALFQALKALHPQEYGRYEEILFGPYQYTYNILCARRPVFEDYCQWFFEITEYMETLSDEVPEIGSTRALSYVAEVLTNLYFMDNEKNWKIFHTGKEIYT